MKIKRNFRTGGCSTNLVVNNKHYYADASPVKMAGKYVIETMIFTADDQFNVTDWADSVFTDIDPYKGGQVEEELLKLKIESFKNSLKPEMSEKQIEIIDRLLNLSKAQVEICTKALSDNATEQDIELACYFAHLQNIK